MNNKQRNEEQNFGDWNIYGIGSYSPEYAANLSRPGLLLVGQLDPYDLSYAMPRVT